MITLERLLPLLVAVSLTTIAGANDDVAPVSLRQNPVPLEAPTAAQSGDEPALTIERQPFDMSWWSVDGGGGVSVGGSFTLTAAVGQPESGFSSSGGQVLDGGLWSSVIDLQTIFCDGFELGDTTAWSAAVP